jgi:hypothetical protein
VPSSLAEANMVQRAFCDVNSVLLRKRDFGIVSSFGNRIGLADTCL